MLPAHDHGIVVWPPASLDQPAQLDVEKRAEGDRHPVAQHSRRPCDARQRDEGDRERSEVEQGWRRVAV